MTPNNTPRLLHSHALNSDDEMFCRSSNNANFKNITPRSTGKVGNYTQYQSSPDSLSHLIYFAYLPPPELTNGISEYLPVATVSYVSEMPLRSTTDTMVSSEGKNSLGSIRSGDQRPTRIEKSKYNEQKAGGVVSPTLQRHFRWVGARFARPTRKITTEIKSLLLPLRGQSLGPHEHQFRR